jgi:hypothetical protein
MLYAKPWEHPSAVATPLFLILLSARINTSTRYTVSSVDDAQQGDLVEHHLRLSNVLERISRPTCEPLYVADTSHHKQETFLYEYSFVLCPFAHKKRTTLIFGRILLKHGRHFDYRNQPLNMRMYVS